MFSGVEDLGYAIRFAGRCPKTTATLILTLATAVAASTTIVSVVNVVFLRPLPYRDPSSLVLAARLFPQGTPERATYAELSDWRVRGSSFQSLAAIRSESYILLHENVAQQVQANVVTANLFSMLDARPLLGRWFLPQDEQPGVAAAILSESTWRNRFSADPNIVGKRIRLADRRDVVDREIVGVMPSQMRVFELPQAAVFLPQPYPLPAGAVDPGPVFLVFGRLKFGVSVHQARADLTQLILRGSPSHSFSPGAYLVPLHQAEFGRNERGLRMLALSVGLLMLIACINIAGLLLAVGATRRHELAVRAAIGASRGRLMRQLLIEHALLTGVGAALGGALTVVGIRVVLAVSPPDLPRLDQLGMDWSVFGVSCTAAAAAGILSGFLPALLLSRSEITGSLKGVFGAGRQARWRDGLVAAQLGLVLAVVVAGTLSVHGLWKLVHVQLGYDPTNVVATEITLGPKWQTPDRIVEFQRDLLRRVYELGDVEGAALTQQLPPSSRRGGVYLSDGRFVRPVMNTVSRDYFSVLRIPILRGATVTQHGGNWPIVVSESFARQFLPMGRDLGQGLTGGRIVVGVVGDTWQQEQTTPAAVPTCYVDLVDTNNPWDHFWLLARPHGDGSVLVSRLREIIRSIDSDLPLRFTALDEHLAGTRVQLRFFAVVLGGFAAVGLLLAAIGVFTAVHQSVSERAREIGIRIALGAAPAGIRRLILRRIVALSVAALAIGTWLGVFGARGLRSVLFGLTTTDVPTLLAAAMLVGAVAGVAAWNPLRRAVSLDPITILREE